jgi:putative glutamine amidotransferase
MPLPTIGITQASNRDHPLTLHALLHREAYYRAIRQAGGIPTAITSANFKVLLPRLNGIVFSGGGDINPCIYGDTRSEFVTGVDNQRDSLEIEIFCQIVKGDMPFLGICRGLQLINVARGGSLYRDLAQQKTGSLPHDWHPSRRWLAHEVSLNPVNLLYDAGFPRLFSVNSLHHQGINIIGKGLSVISLSSDGLAEAIQLTGHRFGLAVQWHPEWLTDQQPTQNLFVNFINSCERTHL